jgi:hypothetical protein
MLIRAYLNEGTRMFDRVHGSLKGLQIRRYSGKTLHFCFYFLLFFAFCCLGFTEIFARAGKEGGEGRRRAIQHRANRKRADKKTRLSTEEAKVAFLLGLVLWVFI